MMDFGLCNCGCGKTTPIATKTDKRRGYRKGEHTKYCPGHVQRTQGRLGGVVVQPWTGELTQDDLIALRASGDEEAACAIDVRVRCIERTTRHNFVELGMLCLEAKNRDLWAKLTDPDTGVVFHSWEAWIASALNVSRSSAYAAVKAIEATKGIPLQDLKDMSRENLQQFARLSTKAQPKFLEAAKTLKATEFVSKINMEEPNQHLSKAPKVSLDFSDDDRKLFDQAVAVAQWAESTQSRDEAVMAIIHYYLMGACEVEGYLKQSNVNAYETAKKRGHA